MLTTTTIQRLPHRSPIKPYPRKQSGFTIVELLIVVVIIAILAAITVVAYNGMQDRARWAKMSSDLKALEKAVHLARTQTGQVLINITNSSGTADDCVNQASGTDLAALPRTNLCWVNYAAALDRISTAGGMNVRGLVDPWGRPYFIDENENEDGSANCTRDHLATYTLPFIGAGSWTTMSGTDVWVANSAPGC